MRKILFLIDTLETGGAEKSLLEITKRFKKFEPVFVHLFPGISLKAQFEEAGIEVRSMNYPVNYDFKSIARQLIPIVKEVNPVLIHSTLFGSDMVARILKKEINIPIINSLVNNSYSKRRYKELGINAKIKLFLIQNWDRITSQKVDMFISNSQAIKLTNSEALNIPLDRIKVIYRGRDPHVFKSVTVQDTELIRKKLSLDNKKIFLNVSRLLPRKGQRDLLIAYKQVYSLYPDSKLVIAGEGDYRPFLQNLINKLGLNDNVILLGNRTDIPTLLKTADFFVFPSHYEGLPGALIEAVFAKGFIITSNIPENLECVLEDSVMTFQVGDIEDLKNQMIKVLQDNHLRPDIEKGYEFAIKNFSIRNVVTQYENTYDELLRNLN